jgi:hypothetical protein
LQELLKKIDAQIEARINGILLGMQTRLNGLQIELEARTSMLEKAIKNQENMQSYIFLRSIGRILAPATLKRQL